MAHTKHSINANYYYYGAVGLKMDKKGREGENNKYKQRRIYNIQLYHHLIKI